jgi:hypothetical protein
MPELLLMRHAWRINAYYNLNWNTIKVLLRIMIFFFYGRINAYRKSDRNTIKVPVRNMILICRDAVLSFYRRFFHLYQYYPS